jgi:hypothetical protein
MPNWCENDLYISGPRDQVDALLTLMGDDFDFNAVLPYPAELRQRDDDARAWEKEHGWVKAREMLREKYGGDADGYNAGGYEWCVSAWGTKWPAKDAQRRDLGGQVCVSFETPWGPPVPVVAELHRQFPTLTLSLEFFERGMAFAGGVTFCCEEDFYREGQVWAAGVPCEEWKGEYRGERGG